VMALTRIGHTAPKRPFGGRRLQASPVVDASGALSRTPKSEPVR
jgi:hypothetical protein